MNEYVLTKEETMESRVQLAMIRGWITKSYSGNEPQFAVVSDKKYDGYSRIGWRYFRERMAGETLMEFCDRVGKRFIVAEIQMTPDVKTWVYESEISLEDAIEKWNDGQAQETCILKLEGDE